MCCYITFIVTLEKTRLVHVVEHVESWKWLHSRLTCFVCPAGLFWAWVSARQPCGLGGDIELSLGLTGVCNMTPWVSFPFVVLKLVSKCSATVLYSQPSLTLYNPLLHLNVGTILQINDTFLVKENLECFGRDGKEELCLLLFITMKQRSSLISEG